MAATGHESDHDSTVGKVIIVALVVLVGGSTLLVVFAAMGIVVYLFSARGVPPTVPPPPPDFEPVAVVEPISADSAPEAGVVSPLLDSTAREHMTAAGVAWSGYEAAVGAQESGNRSKARELLATHSTLPDKTAALEEFELLALAADVGEQPPGVVAMRMLAWRERYPESRLTHYSQLVDGKNCVGDAQQQGSAEGAAEGAGDTMLQFCTIPLGDLGRFTATDPYVSGVALYELGYAHKNLDQPDEALAAWMQLANEVPGHPRAPMALYAAGNLAWAEERYSDAASLYGAFAEQYPDDRKFRTVTNNKRAVELVGAPAPELVVDHWLGTPTALADHRGEVVLLVFWNEWCDHCHKQFPWAQELQDRYGTHGLTVLLVTKNNKEQTDAKVAAFLDANATTLPCAVEPVSHQTTADYAVYGVPTAAVISRDGTVVWRNHPNKLTDDKIEALLGP